MGNSKFMSNLKYKSSDNSRMEKVAQIIEQLHPNEKIKQYRYNFDGISVCGIREDILRELEILNEIAFEQKHDIDYTFQFTTFEFCVVGQLAVDMLKHYDSFTIKYQYQHYFIKDNNRDIDIFSTAFADDLIIMLYQLPREIKTLLYTEWEIANL
jgi:hypothetical protein